MAAKISEGDKAKDVEVDSRTESSNNEADEWYNHPEVQAQLRNLSQNAQQQPIILVRLPLPPEEIDEEAEFKHFLMLIENEKLYYSPPKEDRYVHWPPIVRNENVTAVNEAPIGINQPGQLLASLQGAHGENATVSCTNQVQNETQEPESEPDSTANNSSSESDVFIDLPTWPKYKLKCMNWKRMESSNPKDQNLLYESKSDREMDKDEELSDDESSVEWEMDEGHEQLFAFPYAAHPEEMDEEYDWELERALFEEEKRIRCQQENELYDSLSDEDHNVSSNNEIPEELEAAELVFNEIQSREDHVSRVQASSDFELVDLTVSDDDDESDEEMEIDEDLNGVQMQPSQTGTRKCRSRSCGMCKSIAFRNEIKGPKGTLRITDRFTCANRNVIYAVLCKKCTKVYIGESGRKLRVRFGEHKRNIKSGVPYEVYKHFRTTHTIDDMIITAICHAPTREPERKAFEAEIISELGTMFPDGLNSL